MIILLIPLIIYLVQLKVVNDNLKDDRIYTYSSISHYNYRSRKDYLLNLIPFYWVLTFIPWLYYSILKPLIIGTFNLPRTLISRHKEKKEKKAKHWNKIENTSKFNSGKPIITNKTIN